MAHRDDIQAGKQVLGSDGGMVGVVEGLHGDHIHVKPTAPSPGAAEHTIPLAWVSRVDDHVHLDRTAAQVRDTWGVERGTAGAAAGAAAAPRADGDRTNWLPWLIGLALLLAVLFFGIRGCDDARDDAPPAGDPGNVTAGESAATGGAIGTSVQTYFASSDVAPKTFTFENLNFDTSSAEIRPENREELAELGRILAGREQSRVRVVGYADARGSEGANQNLGLERARAVAAALSAAGVDAGRIETASGGEENPQATNANPQGRFENRRTELVILSR